MSAFAPSLSCWAVCRSVTGFLGLSEGRRCSLLFGVHCGSVSSSLALEVGHLLCLRGMHICMHGKYLLMGPPSCAPGQAQRP